MADVSESAFLPYSVEEVFWDTADPAQQRRWDAASLRSLEPLADLPLGAGARYRAVFRGVGPVEFEFLEFDPPKRYVHLTTIPFGQMRHTFTFTPEGSGTRLTQQADLRLGLLGRLARPLVAWSVARRMQRVATEVSRDLAARRVPAGAGAAGNGPDDDPALEIRLWGLFGAFWAALFAVWLLFFSDRVPDFAWVVKPRLAQVFIGAGYVFRTGLFLSVALWPVWSRMRWLFWGNLVFTGSLLFATYWHADQIRFGAVIGHAWLFLYIAEPIVLIYLSRGRSLRFGTGARTGGPVGRWFGRFLVLAAGLLLMFGLLMLLNPEFAARRWPWELNPLDSQIASAWVLGWAAWTMTMAFARDWDEIRTGAALGVLQGAALLVANLASLSLFDSPRAAPYLVGIAVLTATMALFFWNQERHRPGVAAGIAGPGAPPLRP